MKAIQYAKQAILMLAAGLMISCGGDPADGDSDSVGKEVSEGDLRKTFSDVEDVNQGDEVEDGGEAVPSRINILGRIKFAIKAAEDAAEAARKAQEIADAASKVSEGLSEKLAEAMAKIDKYEKKLGTYENEMEVIQAKVRLLESGWEDLKQKNEDALRRAERAESALKDELTSVRKIYTE